LRLRKDLCSALAAVPHNDHAARRPTVRTVRIHLLAHTSSPVDCASCGGLVGTELARYRGGSDRRHPGRSGPQLPQVRDSEVHRPPAPPPAERRSGRASRRARAPSAAPDWRRRRSAACHLPDPDGDGLRASFARTRRSWSVYTGVTALAAACPSVGYVGSARIFIRPSRRITLSIPTCMASSAARAAADLRDTEAH
jgi:hypothetical protein